MESINDKILLIEKLYDKVFDVIDNHKAETQFNVLVFAYSAIMKQLAKHYPENKEDLLQIVERHTDFILEEIERATNDNNIAQA